MNHFCKVSHLFGQNLIAPSTELHSLYACLPVSLAGNGFLLKYMSWDVMLALNSFTAVFVSCFPVIFFASESICAKKDLRTTHYNDCLKNVFECASRPAPYPIHITRDQFSIALRHILQEKLCEGVKPFLGSHNMTQIKVV